MKVVPVAVPEAFCNVFWAPVVEVPISICQAFATRRIAAIQAFDGRFVPVIVAPRSRSVIPPTAPSRLICEATFLIVGEPFSVSPVKVMLLDAALATRLFKVSVVDVWVILNFTAPAPVLVSATPWATEEPLSRTPMCPRTASQR